ncbi:MAG: hypothetical protein ACP5N2_01725 [Candidatus Nanoarchaeia archaeon]
MKETISETRKKEIEEYRNLSNTELMDLSLSKNDKWSDTYQMVIAIRQNDDIKELKKSAKYANIITWITVVMTALILILNLILVWKAY